MPDKKNYFILYNYLTTISFCFTLVVHHGRRLFLYNDVSFTKRNSKLILVCIDYDLTVGIEKKEPKRSGVNVALCEFLFFFSTNL